MPPAESPTQQSDGHPGSPPIQCDACESALHGGEHTVAFLLLDRHTIPLVGCDEHVDQFATVCGYTTDETARVLNHRPAGGVPCPSCHLAHHSPRQLMIPVQDGAIAVLACADHQSTIAERFQRGLETHQQLTTSLDLS